MNFIGCLFNNQYNGEYNMRMALVIIALLINGCSLKTCGDLLTGSISINDNINNTDTTKVLDTVKDVNNGVDRINTIGHIFGIYIK